ncbi:heme utilization cystosolic carrier protein HutX [Vibrio parahaemolyticus]|nr:heme utilization cystosolic carrier protein HutX [Vibrio parahaemolyticus]EGR1379732.1 heme utilization cystosolic carrier protein HutX [Vibrio parahaemolyticus]
MENKMESIKQQVEVLLEQEPQLLPAAMAERLGVTEFDVVAALPQEMVAIAPGEQAQTILESLVGFGPVTTIVHSFGSIFEVKAPFPKGKVARGYYNLMGREGELHGHLKLDNVKNIALVSKPFMGRESHYFGFFSEYGSNIFKVYLGRDEKRELIAEQVTAFRAMQVELNQ